MLIEVPEELKALGDALVEAVVVPRQYSVPPTIVEHSWCACAGSLPERRSLPSGLAPGQGLRDP
jgi:hypothetical protein